MCVCTIAYWELSKLCWYTSLVHPQWCTNRPATQTVDLYIQWGLADVNYTGTVLRHYNKGFLNCSYYSYMYILHFNSVHINEVLMYILKSQLESHKVMYTGHTHKSTLPLHCIGWQAVLKSFYLSTKGQLTCHCWFTNIELMLIHMCMLHHMSGQILLTLTVHWRRLMDWNVWIWRKTCSTKIQYNY